MAKPGTIETEYGRRHNAEHVNQEKWALVDRSEYERMKSASLRVRKIVIKPGPKGTRFEANIMDLRRWMVGKDEEI